MHWNTCTVKVDDEGQEYLSLDYTECIKIDKVVFQVKPGITAISERMVVV